MADKKMTQRDFFNECVKVFGEQGRDDLVEFAKGRIEALDKKSENKKPSKTQVENEGVKEVILAVLAESENPMTVTEMLATKRFEENTSNQKLSALLRQLIADNKVVKTMDKKSAKFGVVR